MLNRVILIGRMTADPELRQTQSGISFVKFNIAVNRKFKDDNGERQADFISITAWRKTAEFIADYFSKGQMIVIEGSLRNNNYTDANGVKHYSMDVLADNVSFAGGRNDNYTANTPQTKQVSNPAEDVPLGDLADFEEVIAGDEPPF